MKRSLIKSFLLDHVSSTIAFFSTNVLICVFYSIVSNQREEILYPFAIILFVYLIWMAYRFVEYSKLYRILEDLVIGPDYDTCFHHRMSKRVIYTINHLHHDYQDKLADIQNSAMKERRFLSQWIHNMKTPVSVIDLLMQRMNQGDVSSEEGFQSIKEENKKLLEHLDTILNMVRLEDFAKDYIPEPINIEEQLKEIINKQKNQFIYQHVFPKIIAEQDGIRILSDRKWNELLISQLISNGIKYSATDHKEAKHLYFMIEKKENQMITLTIKDEGIGIPEYDLGKVFDAFFTGENGRKDYSSSGIGLYFCKEICRRLGHSITITSKVGEGTSVTISYLAKL